MADVNQDVNLSSLDRVRRLFGMPTLLEQMQSEKVKATQAATAIPAERNTATAFRQNQSAMDAAMEELRRQSTPSGGR